MKVKHLLYFIAFSFLSLSVKAGSIAGGTISYRAIDSVNYEVTTLIYLPCDSIPPAPSDTLFVSWPGGGFATNMVLAGARDVTGTYDKCTTQSKCSGSGGSIGYYEYTFKATVNVASAACLVTFSYKNGTRVAYISTGPAGTDFYIYAQLNKCVGINSSAHITLPPQIVLPVGQDAQFNSGFIDTVDGDSMGFRLEYPLSSAGSIVSYTGSWYKSSPVTYLGFPYTELSFPAGFHFDSATSHIAFRPTKQNEVGTIVIEAIEYRKYNGTMVEIGRTRLEHILHIIASPNNKTPRMSGLGSYSVCVGSQICIPFTSEDVDNSDTTHIVWNNGIIGATFTPNTNGRLAGGTLCWAPAEADVRNWPHYYTVRVHDESCGPNATATKTVGIMVYKKIDSAYLDIERKDVACNTLKLKMKKPLSTGVTRKFASPNGHLYINTADSAEILFKNNGWNKYSITTTFNGVCTDYFLDSVWIQMPYQLQILTTPDTVVCPNDSFTMAATPTTGIAPYTYNWLPANISTNNFVTAITTNNQYILFTNDSSSCLAIDTVNVRVHKPQTVKFLFADNICGSDAPYVLKVTPTGGSWTGSTPAFIAPDTFAPKLAVAGMHTLLYQALDSNNCKISKPSVITVNPYSVPAFYVNPTQGIAPLQAMLVSQATPKPTRNWWFITNTITNHTDTVETADSVLNYTFTDTGLYTIALTPILGWCTEMLTKTDYVIVDAPVGIKHLSQNKFNILPNPITKGNVLVLEGEGSTGIIVYDAVGREIKTETQLISNTKTQINTTGFAPGVYWLHVFINNNPAGALKFIINP